MFVLGISEMSLVEFFLAVIAILLGVVAFNTSSERTQTRVASGMKRVCIGLVVTAGLWLIFVKIMSPGDW